ncbi:hypothetical protein [Sediminibacterium goheungense]|uniref:KAP-like P-loop domain-containing protein n=1 Tax=Sediminibacterium goheungense TaxID=1086393 RepID=A0A4R6ITZ5_9BACT|nr:hypothetical protein [Sediminibacterium goheungense]TDO25751.1 hypothetical protein BC659_2674 [Sediminibacterium goheungense]
MKVSGRIIKMALQGFLSYKQIENINLESITEDTARASNEFLDTNELFICFDDLERKDSNLSFADLIGYINTLVDQNIKILIICNEDIIGEDDEYKTHIEKIIGIKFPYQPDISQIINSITTQEYAGYPEFTQKLKEHNDLLVLFTKKNNTNFRSCEYGISILHDCFSKIEQGLENLKNDTKEEYVKQTSNIIRFILIIAIEYKQNRISYKNINDFRKLVFSLSDIFNDQESYQDSTTTQNREILTDLLKKYNIQTGEYRFFQSLFRYITEGSEFTSQIFFEEFQIIFQLTDDKIPFHYKIFNQLDYKTSLLLEEEEYLASTIKMLDYAKLGHYDLPEYLTIIFYIERYNNPLNLNFEHEIEELKAGFSIAANRIKNTTSWDNAAFMFENSYSDRDMSELNMQFYQYGMEIINIIKEEKNNIKRNETAQLFKSDFTLFIKKYQSNGDFRNYVDSTDFLKEISDHELITLIYRISLHEIQLFNLFIKQRYHHANEHNRELPILEHTITMLETNIKSTETTTNTPRKLALFKQVLECLKKATKAQS